MEAGFHITTIAPARMMAAASPPGGMRTPPATVPAMRLPPPLARARFGFGSAGPAGGGPRIDHRPFARILLSHWQPEAPASMLLWEDLQDDGDIDERQT